MRIAASLVIAALISTSAFGQEFYLKLDQTGQKYGPYQFKDGAKVQIGQGTFSVATDYVKDTSVPMRIEPVTVSAAPDTALGILEPEPDPAAIMAEVMKEEKRRANGEDEETVECEPPEPAPDRTKTTIKRLKKTKIKRYTVSRAALRDAVKYLAHLVSEEAGRKDYPIKFALATDDASAPNAATSVSLSLKKTRADEIARVLADQTAYTYRVDDDTVIFSYGNTDKE